MPSPTGWTTGSGAEPPSGSAGGSCGSDVSARHRTLAADNTARPAGRQLWRGLECVPNISEGRNPLSLRKLQGAAGDLLLDTHDDPDHNRCVLTICSGGSQGENTALGGDAFDAVRSTLVARMTEVATAVVAEVDLRNHEGVHPRFGSLDVVPFVSLRRDGNNRVCNGPIDEAVEARRQFMEWAASELALPCFCYGPERSLPDVRRNAFRTLRPDTGPREPHPTAGSCAVGARPLLVAYNLWLSDPARDERPNAAQPEQEAGANSGLDLARAIARAIRGPAVRALGLSVGARAQVSMNLIDPFHTTPTQVYDQVALLAEKAGAAIERAELVGLVPMRIVVDSPVHRLAELGLSEEQTIESYLERRQL